MLNPIFWKKVQGQKHPGRWGIVEHQIPSIKVLFKTNAKSHKHPGIKPLSPESKTQLVNQRKQNSYRRAYIYTYIYIYIYQHRASGREQRSSEGNTSSNPQVSAPVPHDWKLVKALILYYDCNELIMSQNLHTHGQNSRYDHYYFALARSINNLIAMIAYLRVIYLWFSVDTSINVASKYLPMLDDDKYYSYSVWPSNTMRHHG